MKNLLWMTLGRWLRLVFKLDAIFSCFGFKFLQAVFLRNPKFFQDYDKWKVEAASLLKYTSMIGYDMDAFVDGAMDLVASQRDKLDNLYCKFEQLRQERH